MSLYLGTFDDSFGLWAGAALEIDNIRVISTAPPTPINTTGAVTFEAEEILLPGSEIVMDIDDLTSLWTQVGSRPWRTSNSNFHNIWT